MNYPADTLKRNPPRVAPFGGIFFKQRVGVMRRAMVLAEGIFWSPARIAFAAATGRRPFHHHPQTAIKAQRL